MVPNATTLLAAKTTTSSLFNGTFGMNSTFLIPTFISQEEFLALQMTNTSDANTTLETNDTVIIKTWYPSGYSPAHIILASVVVTVLMIMVVVGNMLVIIAIMTEKALKNIQNWFIASLAVADFFLGLIIMPFSLANELMGYWIFGFWWCEIHSAMDVLLCTASIMNLCLISLDRYWSITQINMTSAAAAAANASINWDGLIAVGIPNLIGIIAGVLCMGNIANKDGTAWWQVIKKPSWTIATWLFGPVFIYVHSGLGYASYLVYLVSPKFEENRDMVALLLYVTLNIQIVVGYAFLTRFHKYAITFYNIFFANIVFLSLTIIFYQINPVSFIFMIPMAMWQLYSTFLSHAVWILNAPKADTAEDYQNFKV